MKRSYKLYVISGKLSFKYAVIALLITYHLLLTTSLKAQRDEIITDTSNTQGWFYGLKAANLKSANKFLYADALGNIHTSTVDAVSGFIQNTTTKQAASNFNISGRGVANVLAVRPGYSNGIWFLDPASDSDARAVIRSDASGNVEMANYSGSTFTFTNDEASVLKVSTQGLYLYPNYMFAKSGAKPLVWDSASGVVGYSTTNYATAADLSTYLLKSDSTIANRLTATQNIVKTNTNNISTNTTNIASNTTSIGTLSSLTTTAKSNLVAAINEVNAKSGGTTYTFSSEFTNSSNNISINAIAESKVTNLTTDLAAKQGTLTFNTSSIVNTSNNLALSGDAATPGNTMLYGTNSSGVKGWYAQPSGSGGVVQPSTQLVYGTGTGVTSDPSLTFSTASNNTFAIKSPTNAALFTFRHSGAEGVIATTVGAFNFNPASGLVYIYTNGQANEFRVYGSTGGSNYIRFTHNGASGVIGTAAGGLSLTSTSNVTTNTGLFTNSGSQTASAAIARGAYFNNTLVAAANNDVLVGLDINPTFTNGSFTGVNNYALRTVGAGLINFGSLNDATGVAKMVVTTNGVLGYQAIPSGGSGAVASVFGRTGAVVAASGDYSSFYAALSHTHAAADITSGVLNTARLGTGTADATTVLYGDGTWKAAPSGGTATTVSGGIGINAPLSGSNYTINNNSYNQYFATSTSTTGATTATVNVNPDDNSAGEIEVHTVAYADDNSVMQEVRTYAYKKVSGTVTIIGYSGNAPQGTLGATWALSTNLNQIVVTNTGTTGRSIYWRTVVKVIESYPNQ